MKYFNIGGTKKIKEKFHYSYIFLFVINFLSYYFLPIIISIFFSILITISISTLYFNYYRSFVYFIVSEQMKTINSKKK